MSRLLTLGLAALALVGCASSSSGDDASVKPGSGEVTNPGGKPRNDEEATRASNMAQQGAAINDARAKEAAEMAAAKAAAGGK